MEHTYSVYILRCADRSLYTGITNNLDRRIVEHQKGLNSSSYTFSKRPVELVYSSSFSDVYEAIHWEKIVKGWRREKKEALIRRDHEKIEELSRTSKNWMIYPIIKRNRFNISLSLLKPRLRMSPFAGSG